MSFVNQRLEALVAEIQLPDHAYEMAASRYEDVGEWLRRTESRLAQFDPHIAPQGSFALGTSIYPLNRNDDHDLDLSCTLRAGISRQTHSQQQIKDLVGRELEQYRAARRIQDKLEAKRRCWRLPYRGKPGFHLDIVPAIPGDDARRRSLTEEMRRSGLLDAMVQELAAHSIWITDSRHPAYSSITEAWPASNPSGYVRWFQYRLESPSLAAEGRGTVAPLPVYRRNTPLQKAIQLLKRHRDVMFVAKPESKPVSAIITTVAAQVYVPGEDLQATVSRILSNLDSMRQRQVSTVANPVNPSENFADKWVMPEYARHALKENFYAWTEQASADFGRYGGLQTDTDFAEAAQATLQILPPQSVLAKLFGGVAAASSPRPIPVTAVQNPPRPWRRR